MEGRKPRIGIFGCDRGSLMARLLKSAGADIVAVCDYNPRMQELARKQYLVEDGAVYDNFDEFINHDMDGVYVANFFEQHVPYAIRLLDRGISVCTEPICGSNMKQCVDLVRAVERNRGKAVFMFGENYQYRPVCHEMRRIYQTGVLGELMYAHGEYVHPSSVDFRSRLAPGPNHWRNYLASTYYNSHSLAPLMFVTDTMPKTVTAQSAHVEEYHRNTARQMDPCGIMLTKMDNGAIFTTCGCMSASATGVWYRFSCYNGTMETKRFESNMLELRYTNYGRPDDQPSVMKYLPEPPYDAQASSASGHGGADYYVVRNFLNAIESREDPYFDVYRGVAIASVAILGWRSCLDGKTYEIPDFHNEEDLKKWENDTLSPFPDRNGNRSLPSMVKSDWQMRPEDLAYAQSVWEKHESFTHYSWPED